MNKDMICLVDGCERAVLATGYCRRHYKQIHDCGGLKERTRSDPNEFIEHGDFVEVLLYNKFGQKVGSTKIDKEFLFLVSQYKWYLREGYVCCSVPNIKMHRLIMGVTGRNVVDHINGDKTDNRISNLRIVTLRENNLNCAIGKNNTTGYIGVMYYKGSNKYRAYITSNRKRYNLGCFDKLEDAVKVRQEAELKYFGKYSSLLCRPDEREDLII